MADGEPRYRVVVTEQQVDIDQLALNGEVELKQPSLNGIKLVTAEMHRELIRAIWEGWTDG